MELGLASERQPFKHLKNSFAVRTAIHNDRLPDRPAFIPDDLWSLIEDCWSNTPEARPRFDEIVNAPQFLLFSEADVDSYFDFVCNLVQKYQVE
jgi:hypothetical protein